MGAGCGASGGRPKRSPWAAASCDSRFTIRDSREADEAASGGAAVRRLLSGSTTALTEAVFLPLVWFVVLDAEERAFMQTRLRQRLPWLFTS